jgi:hypothetical protein
MSQVRGKDSYTKGSVTSATALMRTCSLMGPGAGGMPGWWLTAANRYWSTHSST